jgi:carotenoid 1,2-hydratase
MTERGRAAVVREPTHFGVGPSSMTWEDDVLVIKIDEVGVPIPQRIKGTVRIKPRFLCKETVTLEDTHNHCWMPIAPVCDVDVVFERPYVHWRGTAYLDSNWGSSPLETAFEYWTWSRTRLHDSSVIYYDYTRISGERSAFALHIDGMGRGKRLTLPPQVNLPSTLWRVPRSTFSAGSAQVIKTLEDTPFYSRSLIKLETQGETALSVHESLSLSRFRKPIIQAMLPFRMPRRGSGPQRSLSRLSL